MRLAGLHVVENLVERTSAACQGVNNSKQGLMSTRWVVHMANRLVG